MTCVCVSGGMVLCEYTVSPIDASLVSWLGACRIDGWWQSDCSTDSSINQSK